MSVGKETLKRLRAENDTMRRRLNELEARFSAIVARAEDDARLGIGEDEGRTRLAAAEARVSELGFRLSLYEARWVEDSLRCSAERTRRENLEGQFAHAIHAVKAAIKRNDRMARGRPLSGRLGNVAHAKAAEELRATLKCILEGPK